MSKCSIAADDNLSKLYVYIVIYLAVLKSLLDCASGSGICKEKKFSCEVLESTDRPRGTAVCRPIVIFVGGTIQSLMFFVCTNLSYKSTRSKSENPDR